MEPITVWLDGVPHGFRQGAQVWMLVGRLPEPERMVIAAGDAFLADAAGHELGSGGALRDGQRLRLVRRR
ncbi:MAG: hypothetical protein VKS61_18420 [Candidatus Sericytochromatia bacterium]|nr:hypothetical protein [Candidatus Sericytochromatia bacterium]